MIICRHISKSYSIGHGRKQVLTGLDFTINRGERVGILGRNGAGKSTLIKLVGGVELPDSGQIERAMTTSWPLGFGGGFQGSLTGYDNARFIARIYGQDYRNMRDFIEEFTELGRQLKMPVKTYSSGMKARLAFALSLAIEFDCYLIDEVILVGDQDFQKKCHDEFFVKRGNRAMVLASHNPDTIRSYCSRAVVLDKGQGTVYNDIEEALSVYSAL